MHQLRPALMSFAMLAAAACGGGSESAGVDPAADVAADQVSVTVDAAYIRQPAAGRDVTSGGATLLAETEDLILVGASSPIAESIELHSMKRVDGMMRMDQIDSVPLPAGVPVSLKGGGDHFMLFGVKDLSPDTPVPLKLVLETGDGSTIEVDVQADVQSLGE
ncbi:MAG: copper chaperone PCu(A)C [Pseudomonadota bacterium]